MLLCDRCKLSFCCSLEYLSDACDKARTEKGLDIHPTNAEAMSSMSAEELGNCLSRMLGLDQGETEQSVKDWLAKPYSH